MDGWMDGQIDRQIMDGWMDGWMDRQIDNGWMDGWMDGWTDICETRNNQYKKSEAHLLGTCLGRGDQMCVCVQEWMYMCLMYTYIYII